MMGGRCVHVEDEERRSTQFGAISGVRNEKREGGRRGNRQKKATQKIGRSTKVRRN